MRKALASLPFLVALSGCAEPPDQRHFMPQSDPERGLELVESVGCGACHTIPGVGWPNGRVGPPLEGFAARTLIAGRAPNEPEILAAFVRNAPAVVPDSGMPAMPLTPQDSRDVAAYLYTLQP